MSNHFITENIIVAFENMHHLNKKRSGKVREMALKLDILLIVLNGVAWRRLCIK